VWRVLKPGGQVLFRDYGRGDLAQVRFKKGRYMEENFYVRGDGTRVYFFEQDELEEIWAGKEKVRKADAGEELAEKTKGLGLDEATRDATTASSSQGPRPKFETAHIGVDRRMLVNRQRRLKMYRCWMQAVFKKTGDDSQVATSTLRQEKQSPEEGEAEGEDAA
jgi:tRNAThr (cytosine32-N3)-methyltransferase